MNRKGSITIFLSLLLTIMISLVCTSILSVKVYACRMQLANAVDQGMFSLFARYDRDLLEKYDVFFIDGSCGASGLHLGRCYDRVTDAMSYLLNPEKGNPLGGKSLIHPVFEGGSVTGFTLASDLDGAVFAAQALDYMNETAVIQGVRLLMEKTAYNASVIRGQEKVSETTLKTVEAEELPEKETLPSPDFKNPMPEMIRIKTSSVLKQVCMDPSAVSEKTVKKSELFSGRTKDGGVGVIDVRTSVGEGMNSLLYDEYILQHFGTYRHPEEKSGLSYQTEYVIAGKESDAANLESVAKRLLVLRTAANVLHICRDSTLKAEAEAVAQGAAAILLSPQLAKFFEMAIIGGWAYCESLVDVRGMLDGDRVPLYKTNADWQVQLTDIIGMTGRIDSLRKHSRQGLSYEDYLRVLLALTGSGQKIAGSMDMAESTIRHHDRPSFRLDTCFDSLSVEMKVRAEGRITFTTETTFCYRNM